MDNMEGGNDNQQVTKEGYVSIGYYRYGFM